MAAFSVETPLWLQPWAGAGVDYLLAPADLPAPWSLTLESSRAAPLRPPRRAPARDDAPTAAGLRYLAERCRKNAAAHDSSYDASDADEDSARSSTAQAAAGSRAGTAQAGAFRNGGTTQTAASPRYAETTATPRGNAGLGPQTSTPQAAGSMGQQAAQPRTAGTAYAAASQNAGASAIASQPAYRAYAAADQNAGAGYAPADRTAGAAQADLPPEEQWPPQWRERLHHAKAGRALWTYWSLGTDLCGRPDPRRRDFFRRLLTDLAHPAGTHTFWPCALPQAGEPEDLPEEFRTGGAPAGGMLPAPDIFWAGVRALKARAVIIMGSAAMKAVSLPAALPPMGQTLYRGCLVWVIRDVDLLLEQPQHYRSTLEFLRQNLQRVIR